MNNLAEILKYAPEGTKLYSPLYGEVSFKYVCVDDIWVKNDLEEFYFDSFGRPSIYKDSECMLFPSKEKRDWIGVRFYKDCPQGTTVMVQNYDDCDWVLRFYVGDGECRCMENSKLEKWDIIVPCSEFDFNDPVDNYKNSL